MNEGEEEMEFFLRSMIDFREDRARLGWCVMMHDHITHVWPVEMPIQIAG